MHKTLRRKFYKTLLENRRKHEQTGDAPSLGRCTHILKTSVLPRLRVHMFPINITTLFHGAATEVCMENKHARTAMKTMKGEV